MAEAEFEHYVTSQHGYTPDHAKWFILRGPGLSIHIALSLVLLTIMSSSGSLTEPGGSPPSTSGNHSRKRSSATLESVTDKRVPLACHRCRTKRARCSGDRPVCAACAKAKEECIWPSGRKRKRTRREMEEEERREREAALAQSMMENAIRPIMPSQFMYSGPTPKDMLSWVSNLPFLIFVF